VNEHEFRSRVLRVASEIERVLSTEPVGAVGCEALAALLGSGARLQGVPLVQVERAVRSAYEKAPGPLRVGAKLTRD